MRGLLRDGLILVSAIPALALSAGTGVAQRADAADWAVVLSGQYRVAPNLTYLTASNWDAKLDVYTPADRSRRHPTVLFFHGGGWIRGNKEGPILHILPYLEVGWAVVNVEYRVAPVSLAPAAVEDARCALRWVYRNAAEYGFDTTRIVTTGHSAGGHLALAAGMLPVSAGLDRLCPGAEDPRVAAIVSWYGITDVNDLLQGPNQQNFAVAWLGGQTDREAIARRVSPLSHVRAGLPPILTIHGDADRTVPHSHAVRLHRALAGAGVPNQLLTIPGAGHGGLSPEQLLRAYATIRDFLAARDIRPHRLPTPER